MNMDESRADAYFSGKSMDQAHGKQKRSLNCQTPCENQMIRGGINNDCDRRHRRHRLRRRIHDEVHGCRRRRRRHHPEDDLHGDERC